MTRIRGVGEIGVAEVPGVTVRDDRPEAEDAAHHPRAVLVVCLPDRHRNQETDEEQRERNTEDRQPPPARLAQAAEPKPGTPGRMSFGLAARHQLTFFLTVPRPPQGPSPRLFHRGADYPGAVKIPVVSSRSNRSREDTANRRGAAAGAAR